MESPDAPTHLHNQLRHVVEDVVSMMIDEFAPRRANVVLISMLECIAHVVSTLLVFAHKLVDAIGVEGVIALRGRPGVTEAGAEDYNRVGVTEIDFARGSVELVGGGG